MKEISEFIKSQRKQLKLTQEELSFRTGLGLRFIREVEQQNKTTFRMDKVNALLAFFGKTLGIVPMKRETKEDQQ